MDAWLPKGDQSRKAFISLVLAICAILLLARFIVVPALLGSDPPSAGHVIDETLGNVIATALAATGLALLLLRLFPPPPRPAIVEDVPAHEIFKLLEGAFPGTKRWWFDGSTGRFQRAVTLPQMSKWARREGTSRDVTIVILDPRDEALCLRYANYRQGVLSGTGQNWTVDRVRRDLYATLLAALKYNAREPLTVTIALKSTMSILRYDLSDSRLVMTKEGRNDPAISYPVGSFHYDAYLENLRLGLKQSRRVDLSTAVVPLGRFDHDSVRAAFDAMEVDTPTLNSDSMIDEVIAESLSMKHPYS